MDLDLKRAFEDGDIYVVYIRSSEELTELSKAWSELSGQSLDYNFLKGAAANADLCLDLKFRRGDGRYDWLWSDKSFYFVDHPEIEVHTLDDLRIKPSDLGEIEAGELDLFALFLEVTGGD